MTKGSVPRRTIFSAPTTNLTHSMRALLAFCCLSAVLVACGRNRATPTATPEPTTTPTIATTPIATSTPTPQPTPAAEVLPEHLYVRSGPSGEALPISVVEQGATVTILGQLNQCEWLTIATADGSTGWVMGKFVEPNVPCDEIAEAIAPTDETEAESDTIATATPVDDSTVTPVANNDSGNDDDGDGAATPTAEPTAACIAVQPGNWSRYRGIAGDTLSAIALRSNTTVAQLAQVNCIVDGQIFAGQLLFTPPIARPTDTLTPKLVEPPTLTPTPSGTPELRPLHTPSVTTASNTSTPTPKATDTPPVLGGSPTPTNTVSADADAQATPLLDRAPTLTTTPLRSQ